jgi:hypothetical protein
VGVDTRDVSTRRGDMVRLSLFTHAGEDPTILVSVLDCDDSAIPTAELTLPEAGELRDRLRALCELGTRARLAAAVGAIDYGAPV